MFSNILPKWGTKSLPLKMSLRLEIHKIGHPRNLISFFKLKKNHRKVFFDENLLDPGNLNHPFEVGGEDSVLDKPAGQFVPLVGVAAVDGETRLSVLVLGILQVTGYFLVHTDNESVSSHHICYETVDLIRR